MAKALEYDFVYRPQPKGMGFEDINGYLKIIEMLLVG